MRPEEMRAALEQWDGRSTEFLEELGASLSVDCSSASWLGAWCGVGGSTKSQDAATWLVLSWCRRGLPVPAALISKVLAAAPGLRGWMSQLHVCQMVGVIRVPRSRSAMVKRFVDGMLNNPRPLVRAWAWDAWARLHADDLALLGSTLPRMLTDAAASVRARGRRLLAEFECGSAGAVAVQVPGERGSRVPSAPPAKAADQRRNGKRS